MPRPYSCRKQLWEWLKTYKWFVFWLMIILAGVGVCYLWLAHLIPDVAKVKGLPSSENEIRGWLQFVTGAATVALAVIAWTQINRVIEKNRAALLLHIDQSLRDPAILKAKQILHHLTLRHKGKSDPLTAIAQDIATLSLSEKQEDVEKLVYLISYFNFMDMLGYFYCKRHIELVDVNSILGEPVINLYKIATLYIEREQKHAQFVYFHLLSNHLKHYQSLQPDCVERH